MFPLDGGETPSENHSAKRLKLGESSYITSPPKSSSDGQQPVLTQNQDGGSNGHELPLSEFNSGSVALGVGDTLLRSLGVSTHPGPGPSPGGTSMHLNSTTSVPPQIKRDKQENGDDEHFLDPVKAFLSSPSKVDRKGETSDVIDLTQDDDDVVMTGTRRLDILQTSRSIELCYGMVKTGVINSFCAPTFPPNRTEYPMLLRFECSANKQSPSIWAYDYDNKPFGQIDAMTSPGILELLALNLYRVQIYLFPIKDQQAAMVYPFFFTVFGPEEEAKKAAILLSRKKMWLTQPYPGFHGGCAYINPVQHLPKPRLPDDLSFVARTAEEIRSDFNTVFDGLDHAENLPEMEPSSGIKTPLLKHQKQGLYFLTSKEQKRTYDENEKQNMSLWRKKNKHGQIFYYHVITGHKIPRRPPDVLGGILADMMGLGKTLQILSLVVTTQQDSQAFAQSPPPRFAVLDKTPLPPIMNAKTTLLISPLSTISNWEEQIQAHVQQGALTSYLYHGPRREQDPKVLAEFDLVITTYNVIAHEYSKHMKDRNKYASPLQQIKFFRIVLDDNDMYLNRAHMIREQRTLQSKAILALHAERRWAVTGTPVQNHLSDLAALTKFIQLKPFDDTHTFNQYIAMPLKNGEENSITHLRLLVDSVTLRRQKDKIDLPPRTDLIVRLDFSPEEKEIYDATAKQSSERVDKVVKEGHIGGKGYVHVLQMILRLRRICAHGRELLGDADAIEIAGLTSSDAINVDEIDETASNLPPNTAYEIFSLMKETNEDVCALCEKKAIYKDPLITMDDQMTAGGDKGKEIEGEGKDRTKTAMTLGFLTTCAHMLCKDCVSSYTSRISEDFEDGMRAACPICSLHNKIHLFELKSDELNKYLTGADTGKLTKKKGFHYKGPSTKVKALLQALFQNRDEGSKDGPIKSVVFSCWTQHMDLIECAFEANGIISVRLDGTQSRTQRNAAIAKFRDDSTVEVILVSLMAGGLGLNLTAACRVYVMEPQWNPAAEAQAVDRIHRLGQKKPVTTVRYIMADSFEEKILKIQEKKTDLANMTMEQGKRRSKEEMSQERIQHLKEMFSDIRRR